MAVHGYSGVGLSAVHIADALGANVIAVDIIDEKLEKSVEPGADETPNAEEVKDVAQEVKRFTEGSRGVDISADALGEAEMVLEFGEQPSEGQPAPPVRADHAGRGG